MALGPLYSKGTRWRTVVKPVEAQTFPVGLNGFAHSVCYQSSAMNVPRGWKWWTCCASAWMASSMKVVVVEAHGWQSSGRIHGHPHIPLCVLHTLRAQGT